MPMMVMVFSQEVSMSRYAYVTESTIIAFSVDTEKLT